MTFDVREATAGDRSEIEALIGEMIPGVDVAARWRWLYDTSPGGKALTWLAIAPTGVPPMPPAFPPLDGSDWLTGDPGLPIKVVLHGLMGPVKVGEAEFGSVMAPLGPTLDDQQIADVLTYVRQRWRNDASSVTAAEVAAVRQANRTRVQFWTASELGR